MNQDRIELKNATDIINNIIQGKGFLNHFFKSKPLKLLWLSEIYILLK